MDHVNIDGVILTELAIIDVTGGDVLHGMKRTDPGFDGFGEAYFSSINPGSVKAWKRHKEMLLNLIVPVGSVRFVIFDDRLDSASRGNFFDAIISRSRYGRLTVPPRLWFGFKGLGTGCSVVLNISNVPHDPDELETRPLDEIDFNWDMER